MDGYEAIDAPFSNGKWGGLEYSKSSKSFLDGSVNADGWCYAVGANKHRKDGYRGPNCGVVQQVELYALGSGEA